MKLFKATANITRAIFTDPVLRKPALFTCGCMVMAGIGWGINKSGENDKEYQLKQFPDASAQDYREEAQYKDSLARANGEFVENKAPVVTKDFAMANIEMSKTNINRDEITPPDMVEFTNVIEQTYIDMYENLEDAKIKTYSYIGYKHAEAEVDTVLKKFPKFDGYSRVFTKLTDGSAKVNATKGLAQKIITICDEIEEYKQTSDLDKVHDMLGKASFEIIKSFEAVDPYAYPDSNGFITIDAGICVQKGSHDDNIEMVKETLNLNDAQFDSIYNRKVPLTDQQSIALRAETIGPDGKYNRIIRNKIMTSYGFKPSDFGDGKKPKDMSKKEWKKQYSDYQEKYEAIADDMIMTMPAHLYVAMRALVHHNPRSLTNLSADEIKALNSPKPEYEAISVLFDSYADEMMRRKNKTSLILLDRVFMTENIARGDASLPMREKSYLDRIEHMAKFLGNPKNEVNVINVNAQLELSLYEIKERDFNGKKIKIAHANGLEIIISDNGNIETNFIDSIETTQTASAKSNHAKPKV